MAPLQPRASGAQPTDEVDVRQFLERYVHQLKAEGAIRSPAVERAFLRVERHRLLQSFYHRQPRRQGLPCSTTILTDLPPSTLRSSIPTPH